MLATLGASDLGADEVRTWRDGKGRTHVTIEGDASEDAAATESAPTSRDDRFSIETSLRRRELERKLLEGATKLVRIRDEIKQVEASSYPLEPVPTPVDPDERERWNDLRRNAILAASSFEEEKRRRLFVLRRDERAALHEIRDLWGAVDRLRKEVRSYYGKLPPWWIDRVRCVGCPTFEEIERELAKNEVEIAGKTEPTPTPTSGEPEEPDEPDDEDEP